MVLNYQGDSKNGQEENSSLVEVAKWRNTLGQQVIFCLAQIMFIFFI